jgi:hypothetical protein
VALYPGGVREMGAPFRNPSTLPGIVRLAFEYKVPLVPVYCHGEKDVCWTFEPEWPWLTPVRRFFNWLIRYPFPTFFYPRLWNWFTGRVHLTTVVGKALNPQDFESEAALKRAYDAAQVELMNPRWLK